MDTFAYRYAGKLGTWQLIHNLLTSLLLSPVLYTLVYSRAVPNVPHSTLDVHHL